MRSRAKPVIRLVAASIATGGAASFAVLLLIDALTTGQAILPGRILALAEAPGAYFAYVGAVAAAGTGAVLGFAAAVWTLARELSTDRRVDARLRSRSGGRRGGVRPRRPRPPRSP